MRPLFIVVEGLDGSGGTTQSRLLKEWFTKQEHETLLTCEPSHGPIGTLIQKALSSSETSTYISDRVLPYLFAADRQAHLDEEINPALLDGKMVISDRYYHSSLAYQGLSIGLSRVAALNEHFQKPDITFILWLEPEISFRRIQQRGEPLDRFETLDRLRNIAEAYEDVYSYCTSQGEVIHKIDARQSIEEIHLSIRQHIQTLVGS
jgi:dTMP kinase